MNYHMMQSMEADGNNSIEFLDPRNPGLDTIIFPLHPFLQEI